jgi:patatin-related protein
MNTTTMSSAALAGNLEPSLEVRFAVVMYGGVSLAIYIHGVAQELLRLVQATARRTDGSNKALYGWDDIQMRSSGRVYRKLSHMPGGGPVPEGRLDEPGPVRFVVDILSGTSAGGINGVFLAKALANQQELGPLQDLWLSQGDIGTLLNDRVTLPGKQNAPQSLLNSRFMYDALVEALRAVEKTRPSKSGFSSPLVDQLDLYVTATDIRGLLLPLRLADGVAYERRYRSVFHFLYAKRFTTGNQRNDFVAANDQFLAFAARATSAFPFAFEPMRLADVSGAGEDAWREFYRDYWNPADKLPFRDRSFGDGGYLDNKPFSYATGLLARRRADRPVQRKLLYIEPSPEHPENEPVGSDKPDVLENVNAALLSLPRYETISQDIERVQERNRLRERMRRITTGLDSDIHTARGVQPLPPALPAEDWKTLDLGDLVRSYGPCYVAYHRLKIADATDGLAELTARLAGFDEESVLVEAVRGLVREWRERNYVVYRDRENPKRPTQNQFLMDFGFRYRLRRIRFVLDRIKQLDAIDRPEQADDLRKMLENADVKHWPSRSEYAAFRAELGYVRRHLNNIYCYLRTAGRRLRTAEERNELLKLCNALGLSVQTLQQIIDAEPDVARPKIVRDLLNNHERALKAFTDGLRVRLRHVFDRAARACQLLLRPTKQLSEPARAVRNTLAHYYDRFDDYDIFLYPIVYGTGGEEASDVEIFRVSPEDARRLINERPGYDQPARLHKLAGTTMGHFGGFLDELWRQNDILWGRLDGAERIITAIWPQPQRERERNQLIAEAQAAIVAETIEKMGRQQALRLLVEAFMRTLDRKPNDELVRNFHDRLMQGATDPHVREVLTGTFSLQTLLDCYHDNFDRDRRPKPEPMLKIIARATTIIGRMLKGLSNRYAFASKPAAWLVGAGRVLWLLVEVAVPQRLPHLLFRYWLRLFYLLEVLLIAGSYFVVRSVAMRKLGAILLAITCGVHLVVTALSLWMSSRRAALRGLAIVLAVALLLLAALGYVEVRHHFADDFRAWLATLSAADSR